MVLGIPEVLAIGLRQGQVVIAYNLFRNRFSILKFCQPLLLAVLRPFSHLASGHTHIPFALGFLFSVGIPLGVFPVWNSANQCALKQKLLVLIPFAMLAVGLTFLVLDLLGLGSVLAIDL